MSSRHGSSSFRIFALAAALVVAPAARGTAQAAATGPELNAALVGQMIRGLGAERQAMTPVEAVRTRQAVLYALADSLGPNQNCRRKAFDKLDEARNTRRENHQQNATARMEELAKKMMTAAMSGNEKEAKRLEAEVQKVASGLSMAEDFSQDTAAVDKRCGRNEPSAADAAKRDDAQKQAEALNEQIRQGEARAQQQAASAAGLTPPQYALAKERIINYLGLPKTDPRASAYSSAEQSALGARLAELKAALGR